MSLYETKVLRPSTPSTKVVAIKFIELDKKNKKKYKSEFLDQILGISWDKDMSSPTGTGSVSFPFSNTDNELIKEGGRILAKVGWVYPDGTNDFKEVFSGFMGNISTKDYKTDLSLDDEGKLLEKEAEVSYSQMKRSAIIIDIIKKAGLKPSVDFTGLKDDVIDYVAMDESDSSGGSGDIITLTGKPSCQWCYNKNGYKVGETYTRSYINKCPSSTCNGREGVLEISTKKDAPEGQFTCSACDSDFCVCGHDKAGGSRTTSTYLTPANSTNSNDSSNTTDSAAADENVNGTEDSTDNSNESKKSYWDMLLDLIEPIEADTQVFNWLDTVYVHKVPDKSTAKLWIKEGINIVDGSVKINDGSPEAINTIVVKYGEDESKLEVVAKDDELVKKYGEKKEEIDKPKFNQQQAEAYAYSQLEKKQRESGFSIDVQVIGNSEWFIGRWSVVEIKSYGIDRTMYIDKISQNSAPDEEWLADIRLVDYKPSQLAKKTSDTSSVNNSSIEKGLAKLKKKTHCYVCRGSCCSAPGCADTMPCIDCFGMSEALYSLYNNNGQKCRIIQYNSAAANSGHHRIVQLYKNGKWVDHDYSGFKSGFGGGSKGKSGLFVYKPAPGGKR